MNTSRLRTLTIRIIVLAALLASSFVPDAVPQERENREKAMPRGFRRDFSVRHRGGSRPGSIANPQEGLRQMLLMSGEPLAGEDDPVSLLRQDIKPSVSQNRYSQNRTIVAHSTADAGAGSLRQALLDASPGDTINVTARGVIALTSGDLVISKDITIRGPGKANLGVSGSGLSRVFHITPGATVSIEGLTITNGSASGTTGFPSNAGGGILNDHAQLTLRDCVVSGNSARVLGGGILNNSYRGGSASLTLVNTTVSGNSAEFTIWGLKFRGFGGGIFSGGGFIGLGPSGTASLTLDNSTVSGNSAAFGGGIFNDGFAGTATATLNRSTIQNNKVVDGVQGFVVGGGGIYNNGDSGVAILDLPDSVVSGNITGLNEPGGAGNGGGIYNDGGSSLSPGNATATLTNTVVSGNGAYGDLYDLDGKGGGIYNTGSRGGSAIVTLNNSTLDRNTAKESGAGVYNYGDSGEAILTVTSSRLTNNVASLIVDSGEHSGYGGGISNFAFSENDPEHTGSARVSLTNSLISGNVAAGFGGGIDNGQAEALATLAITNCEISDNQAPGGAGISTDAYRGSTSVTIADSTIQRNVANFQGGGIYQFSGHGPSMLAISNSTIRENSGNLGGGIMNESNLEGISNLKIDTSTVRDNHAAIGGGIYNFTISGTATTAISASTLSGNAADLAVIPDADYAFSPGGGAVFNGCNQFACTATVSLTNSTLSGNSTRYRGGGIMNFAQNGGHTIGLIARVILSHCTLVGNSAVEDGATIMNGKYPAVDPPPPNPCPTPPPGAPPCPPPPVATKAILDLGNTILMPSGSGANIQNTYGTVNSNGYNLSSDAIGGDGGTGPGGLLNALGDIRNTNPLLGPLQNNGGPTLTQALLLGSPAINAGDPAFNPYLFTPPLLFDQRGIGFNRILSGRIDIGAFESR